MSMKWEQKIPRVNANDDEAELVFWYFEDGDHVEAGQDLVDIETMKAAMTVPAEGSGYLRKLKGLHQAVAVGEAYAQLCPTRESALESVATEAVADGGHGPRFTKAARTLLEQSTLDPGCFAAGTLVTAEMVEAALRGPGLRRERSGPSKEAEIRALAAQPQALPSSLTIAIPAQHLRSQAVPLQARLLFEISQLVSQSPRFTAYYEEGDVCFYDRLDLGLALDLGKGLKVARIPEAQAIRLEAWPGAIDEVVAAYMNNQLTQADLTQHTLTVTDLSGYDIYQFQPILNGKQAVIIGIGGDRSLPGEPLTITLTFDHRVLSGREVAEFLQKLKESLSVGTKPGNCDRCFISLAEYYEVMSRDAVMRVYARPDGTHGLLCHVCASGY